MSILLQPAPDMGPEPPRLEWNQAELARLHEHQRLCTRCWPGTTCPAYGELASSMRSGREAAPDTHPNRRRTVEVTPVVTLEACRGAL